MRALAKHRVFLLSFLLVISIAFTPLLAAHTESRANMAAHKHAAFMEKLGSTDIRIDSLTWIDELLDDCHLDNHERGIVLLQNWKWIADSYLRDVCEPLSGLWEPYAPCDSNDSPEWCKDCVAVSQRIGLDAYFKEMGETLEASQNRTSRFNIMYLMIDALYWVPDAFHPKECEGAAERWFGDALISFLRDAQPSDVVRIGEDLRILFAPLPASITTELHKYAEANPDMGAEERRALIGIVKADAK